MIRTKDQFMEFLIAQEKEKEKMATKTGRVVNVCPHVLAKTIKPDFLFGHRGWTIAAYCVECEKEARRLDAIYDANNENRVMNPISSITTPIPAVEAYALGIPAHVGSVKDEATVYEG
jgi:hypothetical protein